MIALSRLPLSVSTSGDCHKARASFCGQPVSKPDTELLYALDAMDTTSELRAE